MKRALLLASCVVFLCVVVSAQEEEEYEELMDRTSGMMGILGLRIQDKNGPAALESSKKLEALFTQIYEFFEKRNVPDAMKFAKDAGAGFREAGELASGGKFQDAMAKFHATRDNCDGCHEAHREKTPNGSFRIKY
ncbi:MAG: hypothetical protein HY316_04820 [Acidobacteria bacterium]|nr:hypothetical protein [Acidobacteriota bacterium]